MIKSPLSNVMTRAGQKNITLECDIIGKPRPEIYVMHNGKQLSDHDVNVSVNIQKCIFFFVVQDVIDFVPEEFRTLISTDYVYMSANDVRKLAPVILFLFNC